MQFTYQGTSPERLDKLLGKSGSGLSRARFQMLIAQGHVNVDGAKIVDSSSKVKPGSIVNVVLPAADDPQPRGEDIALDVVYEDNQIIVINKPAGLVVHPGAGNWTGTLVNALIAHCGESLSGIGGVRRPGIVHRLDKETTGLLVVAKTDKAHHALSAQFAAHGRDGKLSRQYSALVWGVAQPLRGTIDTLIARSTTNRIKMAVCRTGGRRAITHYETVQTLPSGSETALVSRVRCSLETGRTHQIRVHMAHAGHPLLGDSVYGASHKASSNRLNQAARNALENLGRQALHAETLGFCHPDDGRRMDFHAPIPQDMTDLLNKI